MQQDDDFFRRQWITFGMIDDAKRAMRERQLSLREVWAVLLCFSDMLCRRRTLPSAEWSLLKLIMIAYPDVYEQVRVECPSLPDRALCLHCKPRLMA